MKRPSYVLVAAAFALSACSTALAVTPSATPTIIPSATSTVIPSATPTAFPTATPTETPVPAPADPCTARAIWDGGTCRPITYDGDTAVVGLNSPVMDREQLDEIERWFVRRSYPDFPEELFNPTSLGMAERIQDVRTANASVRDGVYQRQWEFIVNEALMRELERRKDWTGAEPMTVLALQAYAATDVWKNSNPPINTAAELKRVIIVDDSLLSHHGGGWKVVNDNAVSFWANDELNGHPGSIPYDIDSRWALDEDWLSSAYGMHSAVWKSCGQPYACVVFKPEDVQSGIWIDYGLVHELTHHLPVGDNYIYGPGNGHSIAVEQPNGARAVISQPLFMTNDHMSSPDYLRLSAPSSYAILFGWMIEPELRGGPQIELARPPRNPYQDEFFFDSLTIRVEGLDAAGVTDCVYMRESQPPDTPAEIPFDVSPSGERLSASYKDGACTVVLDHQQQRDAFPGAYIGLVKDGTVFPLYIPRNLIQTFYWAAALEGAQTEERTFVMKATPDLGGAMDEYAKVLAESIAGKGGPAGRIPGGRDAPAMDANIRPLTFNMYMDAEPRTLPKYAKLIAEGAIDGIGNRYFIEFGQFH